MDEIDLAIELLGDGHALIDAVPTLIAHGTADADLDGESPAALPPYAFDYGQKEAAPVLQAPTPPVLAVVD